MPDFYLNTPLKEYYLQHQEELPATIALTWCMNVTGINRIFLQDHLDEFLFRLTFVLPSLQIADFISTGTKLFSYKYKGITYDFTIKDIEDHLGIEVSNSYCDMSERNTFHDNRITYVTFMLFCNAMRSFYILPSKAYGQDDGQANHFDTRAYKKVLPVNDEAMRAKADSFVREATQMIVSDVLCTSHSDLETKLAELKKRKSLIESYPKFDFNAIPKDIRYNCIKEAFSEKEAEIVLNDEEEDAGIDYYKFIYLAWLYANNLLLWDSHLGLTPVEGIVIDENDYIWHHHENGETVEEQLSLEAVITSYNLEAMVPYLKGMFFNK